MFKANPLFRFLAIFTIAYIALVGLHFIPFVRVIHTSIFIFFEEIIFNIFHPSIHAKLQLIDREVFPAGGKMDFTMFFYNQYEWSTAIMRKGLEPDVTLNQEIKIVSQGPFTLLLALIIATPNNWKRKLIGFLIGLVVLYWLTSIRYTYLVYENAPLLREPSPSLWVSMARSVGPLFRTSEFMMIMMLPVWALVALDLDKIKKLYT